MKRFLMALLCGLLMCTWYIAAAEGEGWYMVDSDKPQGYCYLYSEPSDRDEVSINLGPYENGQVVYVLDCNGGWDGSRRYYLVQTMDGQTGYIHDYSLVPYYGDPFATSPGWYLVSSEKPYGYCYLYSAPSDRSALSYNKGPYENGEMVYVLDYYGGQDGHYNYCYVRTQDGQEGYIHDYALIRRDNPPSQTHQSGWHIVQSAKPDGYCYLYSEPSDRDEISVNLGRYENGSMVYVLDYYGGQDGSRNYCLVRTQDGQVGYVHDYALVYFQTWLGLE